MVKTYLAIINTYWQRALTYRATVIGYRIGEIGEALVLILMWTAIYRGRDIIQGYTLREMITYVLMGYFFMSLCATGLRRWLLPQLQGQAQGRLPRRIGRQG